MPDYERVAEAVGGEKLDCGPDAARSEKRRIGAWLQSWYFYALGQKRGVTVHHTTAANESSESAGCHDQPVRGASRRAIADRVPTRHNTVIRRGDRRSTTSRGGGSDRRTVRKNPDGRRGTRQVNRIGKRRRSRCKTLSLAHADAADDRTRASFTARPPGGLP
jgi:hypothetical protein